MTTQGLGHWAWTAIIFLLIITAPQVVKAAEQTLLLDVYVNGRSLDRIGEFTLVDGALLAQRDELQNLGFRVPASLVTGSRGLIALSTLSGFSSRLDRAAQTLHITASTERLVPEVLQAEDLSGSHNAVESSTGATLDYDINGTSSGRDHVASGLLDLRAFSPWGIASSGVLGYAGGSSAERDGYSAIRLDTTYSLSDPETLRRYRLGDFITGSLGWTRPVRLGGVQVSLDFGIRPDLVTFPLPSVSGSAAVPSTVDVLVNGSQLFSRQVSGGPFQIPQLPVITGAGTISTTLTDAVGRQISTTLPFYASSELLATNLQSFSVQVGAVRRNWGLISNDYGNLAAITTYRRGLNSELTVEATAEGAAGLFMAGGGVVVNVANMAVFNLATAASTGSGQTGAQFSAGLHRMGRTLSLGVSATVASHSFRDVASLSDDPIPQLQLSANAGLSLGRFGSVGIAYAGIDRDVAPRLIRLYVPPGSVPGPDTSLLDGVPYVQSAQHTHVLSASYSVQVAGMAIYATGFRDFSNRGSNGLFVGLSIPLGRRGSVGASVGSGSTGGIAEFQASESPVDIGDWGYQVAAAPSKPSHEFAEVQYKSPWTLLTAGVDQIAQQNSIRLESQGSISFIDDGLFASNTIQDSFAVVDTNGLKGVRVLNENRDIGRTNSAGRLLVPDLRSFDTNHLSIEPTDIPADTTIDITTRDVRPQDRSGDVVKFSVRVSHAALLHLVDEAGKPVPLGSAARLRATGKLAPVGYEGAAYIEDLGLHNKLTVERPNGQRCNVSFDYRPVPGDIPTLGPLCCQEERP